MRHYVYRLFTTSALLATLALFLVPASAGARSHKPRAKAPSRVPQGFFGVDAELFPPVDLASQFSAMAANGVESVRLVISWSHVQPYRSFAQVPAAQRASFQNVGGIPTNFAEVDQEVGQAAAHGMSVLAQVSSAPAWDTLNRPCVAAAAIDATVPEVGIRATAARCSWNSVPRRNAPYGNFLKALVRRYGPHGSFWARHRTIARRPVRMWEIWNEPNFPYQWPQPFARSYVSLLRVAHAAIKHTDRGAKVVLAGFPNFAWTYLSQIYKIRGARKLFDVVDIHPYTKFVPNVIKFLQLVRNQMARSGDRRKPLIAGEFTWPSALGKAPSQTYFGIETTEAGQAKRVRAALPMLAKHRKQLRLIGTYYYTWMSWEYRGAPSFAYSGLLAYRNNQVVAKPALGAFRGAALSLEHCRQKAAVATRCLRR